MLSGQVSSGNSSSPRTLLWKEPFYEIAQDAGYRDRIVQPALLHVRLANHADLRHRATMESAFHGGEGYFLMAPDNLCLLIACRIND